jgi:hypothetical protein
MSIGPDSDPQVPADMRTAAVTANEYCQSLRAAGFTRAEALYLTAVLLSGGPKPPPE